MPTSCSDKAVPATARRFPDSRARGSRYDCGRRRAVSGGKSATAFARLPTAAATPSTWPFRRVRFFRCRRGGLRSSPRRFRRTRSRSTTTYSRALGYTTRTVYSSTEVPAESAAPRSCSRARRRNHRRDRRQRREVRGVRAYGRGARDRLSYDRFCRGGVSVSPGIAASTSCSTSSAATTSNATYTASRSMDASSASQRSGAA